MTSIRIKDRNEIWETTPVLSVWKLLQEQNDLKYLGAKYRLCTLEHTFQFSYIQKESNLCALRPSYGERKPQQRK